MRNGIVIDLVELVAVTILKHVSIYVMPEKDTVSEEVRMSM